MKCPQCGAMMTCGAPHGDGDCEDVEWSDDSRITCRECGHTGTVKKFTVKNAKRAKRSLITTLAPWAAGGRLLHGVRKRGSNG